jgi:hypothetical protein
MLICDYSIIFQVLLADSTEELLRKDDAAITLS